MELNIQAKKTDDTYQISGSGYDFELSLFQDKKTSFSYLKGSTLLFKDEDYSHEFLIHVRDTNKLPSEEQIATKVSDQIDEMTTFVLKNKHIKSLEKEQQKLALELHFDIEY